MELSKYKSELFEQLRNKKIRDAEFLDDPEYKGVKAAIVDPYSERGHFIYELLQNADDARATKVSIVLHKDELWFKHNGSKHFDITPIRFYPPGDLNAILNIGSSPKELDENKIGKFGIGFKSVFSFSDAPEIYDDELCFRIEKLIIPTLLENDHEYRQKGETLFVIPFKNTECFADIESKLQDIEHPTLFLRTLKSVSILINGESKEKFEYSKTIENTIVHKDIVLEKISLENPQGKESILLFSKDLSFTHNNENFTNRISIGYFLKDGVIDTVKNKKVNCFFPTSENFDCAFTIHAPFLLTNNRDRLKLDAQHNSFLVSELATLAAQSLPLLRDYGINEGCNYINSNLFDLFARPKVDWFGKRINDNSYQSKFIDAFEKIVSEEALLLSRNKTYLKLNESVVANGDDLFNLLTEKQLSQLFPEIKCHIDFLDKTVAQKLTKEKYNFTVLEELRYDILAKKITEDFMANQSIDWVLSLYQLITDKGNMEHWVKGRSNNVGYQVFAHSPIVKCTNGSWLTPFKFDNTLNVYYSFDESSLDGDFNYIDLEYRKSEIAKTFFDKLGVCCPNKLDYINQIVIPRYTNNSEDEIEDDVIIADLSLLVEYYKESADDKFFLDAVKNKILFVASDGYLWAPSELYIHSEELDLYFDEYLYIDEDYYLSVYDKYGAQLMSDFFIAIGVSLIPKMLEKNSVEFNASSLSVKFQNYIEKNKEYQKFLCYDFVLHGFSELCDRNSFSKDVSIYLWEKVIPEYAEQHSICKFDVYHKYARLVSKSHNVISSFREELINTKWVLDINEELQAPKDLCKENLNGCYCKNDVVLNFLDIKETHHEITDMGGTEEQQKIYNKGRLCEGRSEEDIKLALELLDKKKQQESVASNNQEQENIPVESALDRHNKRMDRLNSMPNIHPHSSEPAESTIKQSGIDDIDFTIKSDTNQSDPIKRAERNIKAEATRTEKEAIEASDNKELLEELERSEKFTFKWYKLLMTLMHSKKQSGIYKSEIRFANVVVKNNVVILQDANVPIPEWFADASTFRVVAIANGSTSDVSCTFMKADDDRMEISVSNAQDIDLLCNAKVIKVVAENKQGFIESLQSRFVKLAFEEDFSLQQNFPTNVSIVYGPPGTGKTTYLANEIKSLIDANSKINILVLTPTNKAADVIAEKIINFDECLSIVTRYGTTESQLLIDSGVSSNRDTFDISDSDKNVVVTTAARYPYDYMQPDNSFLCEHMWDYVIIDEASMIDIITSSFIVFNSSKSKIIISGDPFQIQPVSQNDMPAYNIYDLVELKDFSKAVSGVDYKFPIKTLTKQYRSINSIGKLVSDFTYNGLLQSDENRICTQYLSLPGLPINEINFVEYNVWNDDLLHGISTVNGSAFHLYAAIFTYNMVKHIANVLSASSGYHTIGIVCPYKAEADAIQRMLEISDINSPSCNVLVGTVHSFQGDECDIMFVVINPPKTISSGVHINNKNILNVAISRARDYLFFVAPKGYSKSPLGNLCNKEKSSTFSTSFAEKIMFEDENYIEQNVSVSFHSNVNVYKETSCKYDVRISDNAIDININE